MAADWIRQLLPMNTLLSASLRERSEGAPKVGEPARAFWESGMLFMITTWCQCVLMALLLLITRQGRSHMIRDDRNVDAVRHSGAWPSQSSLNLPFYCAVITCSPPSTAAILINDNNKPTRGTYAQGPSGCCKCAVSHLTPSVECITTTTSPCPSDIWKTSVSRSKELWAPPYEPTSAILLQYIHVWQNHPNHH